MILFIAEVTAMAQYIKHDDRQRITFMIVRCRREPGHNKGEYYTAAQAHMGKPRRTIL